jgi:hypothetical protein
MFACPLYSNYTICFGMEGYVLKKISIEAYNWIVRGISVPHSVIKTEV